MAYMYILKCADNSYYVGSTKDLQRRFAQHQNGEGSEYTKHRLPVELVFLKSVSLLSLPFYEKNRFKDGQERKGKL